ncbi:MAG: PPC domain-containing protein, partial [Spirochaetaceae bacterium]|nr:PPC domain-containing protein [Spirochaetaceae bacterium]
MKLPRNRFFLALILSLGLTAGICAQTIRPETIAELDLETQRIAGLIVTSVNNFPGAASITLGASSFYRSGEEPPLGTYWSSAMLQSLINSPGRNFKILDPYSNAGGAGTRYRIGGEIVAIDQTIRIYTRLVDTEDAAILAAWQSDFENTPLVFELMRTASGSSSSVPRDSYEPDSRQNPVVFAPDRSLRRTLHNGDEDWFSIRSSGQGVITIEVDGDFDGYLELYDTQDSKIDEDDDSGEGTNPRLEFFAEAGTTYLIKMRGYSSSATGSYTIQALFSSVQETPMEPNNTRNQAYAVGIGDVITGIFQGSNDAEWFSVQVPQQGLLKVYTSGSRDTCLKLYDGRENLLSEDDDGGDNLNARLSSVVEPGLYYIELTEYDGASGLYTLYIELTEALGTDEYENDNTAANAKTIEADAAPQRRTFTDGNDVDWARFTVTSRGYYGIRARGENNLRLDTYIELYDADENLIDEDDDGGENYDSYLSVNLEPGDYYIKV